MSLSSVLLLCVVLLALSVAPASGFFTFQAFNDSACSQPLSRQRFPIIDLPNTDFAAGQPGYDQCVIQPSSNITAIIYRCTAAFVNINVYTLPTLLNASYCPTPYLATPRTLQISSMSTGPVEAGSSCWHLSYLSVDHTSGKPRMSNIYGDITCGTAANQPRSAAPDTHSAHTLTVIAAAAALSLLLLL